ncbi:hypothetical protein PM082_024434 [Marasmius tenuissimus]|nr:hypothetical protein PM082_024434 [Marasmius tenuissimus]
MWGSLWLLLSWSGSGSRGDGGIAGPRHDILFDDQISIPQSPSHCYLWTSQSICTCLFQH